VCGSALRITLEFVLPKDGSLVAVGTYALQFGKALAGLPTFMEIVPKDANMEGAIWDPAKDTCEQGESCQLGLGYQLRADWSQATDSAE
jgi:hypothetical protein